MGDQGGAKEVFSALAERARRTLGARVTTYEPWELLARATGRPRDWFHAHADEPASPPEIAAFEALLARRAAGEPLQYLLGEWEFLGRTFTVDARALIPRAETEAIVEAARDSAPDAHRILDLGTGSGILAITLALERPRSRVAAIDRSAAALALARANARRHAVGDRVLLVASDWLTAISPRSRPFDLAVSNPPYVPEAEAPHLDKTVSEHEPPLALYGGGDGLDPLRVLLASLPPFLPPGAVFISEIGYGQAKAVSALVDASPAFRLEDIRLDHAGIPRTAILLRTQKGFRRAGKGI